MGCGDLKITIPAGLGPGDAFYIWQRPAALSSRGASGGGSPAEMDVYRALRDLVCVTCTWCLGGRSASTDSIRSLALALTAPRYSSLGLQQPVDICAVCVQLCPDVSQLEYFLRQHLPEFRQTWCVRPAGPSYLKRQVTKKGELLKGEIRVY